jgi:hypothetical protein
MERDEGARSFGNFVSGDLYRKKARMRRREAITFCFSFMDNPILTSGNNEPRIVCLDLGYFFDVHLRGIDNLSAFYYYE